MRLACLFLIAACGGSPRTAEPLQSHTSKPRPTTPAPAIKWIDNGLDVSLLPAVASDGSVVVIAEHDSDGGRGSPNLQIVVRDRKDTQTSSFVVLTPDEGQTFFDEAGKHPKLDERIVAGNYWLDELHGDRNLVALTPVPVEVGEERGDAFRATLGDFVVTWQNSRLRITRAGKSLVDRQTPETWLTKASKMCSTCDEMCSNPAFLAGVAVNLDRSIAVLTVSYTGTDSCWEPADQHHVVSW